MATTTSDNDQPSPCRRAAVRLGLFAAAASLAAFGSVAMSASANAAERGASCPEGGNAVAHDTGSGADCKDPLVNRPGAPNQDDWLNFDKANLALDGVFGGLENSPLLGGVRLSRSGAGDEGTDGLAGDSLGFGGGGGLGVLGGLGNLGGDGGLLNGLSIAGH